MSKALVEAVRQLCNRGAQDAGFEEGKHPRGKGGQFASGGAGGGKANPVKNKPPKTPAAAARHFYGMAQKAKKGGHQNYAAVLAQIAGEHERKAQENQFVQREARLKKQRETRAAAKRS